MGFFVWKHMLPKLLVFSLIIHFTCGTAESNRAESEVGQNEDEGEQFTKNLQHNYQNGVGRMLEFFDSVTRNLSKIHERFDDLERKGEERHKKLEEIELGLRSAREDLSKLAQINQRLDDLERVGNERFELLKKPRTAEEYLNALQPARRGKTFNGSTIETISAAVPSPNTLTVQIVNYLETPIQDYKQHLLRAEVHNEAPQTVPAKTREVFTFKQTSTGWRPHGVFSYKLAHSNFDLHLYFYSGSYCEIATAFLPRDTAVNTIYDKGATWEEKPVGWPYESTSRVDRGIVKTTTIQKDGIYGKVTLISEDAAKVKVEIFRFEP